MVRVDKRSRVLLVRSGSAQSATSRVRAAATGCAGGRHSQTRRRLPRGSSGHPDQHRQRAPQAGSPWDGNVCLVRGVGRVGLGERGLGVGRTDAETTYQPVEITVAGSVPDVMRFVVGVYKLPCTQQFTPPGA